jgi:hypothetical protein
MEKRYWIGRKRSAMKMARAARTSQARLIHYELAGLYSIKAAQSLPFKQAEGPRATGGESATLHLPAPSLHHPAALSSRHQGPSVRGDPDPNMEEVR